MSDLPDGWAIVALPHVAVVLDTRRIPLNADERTQRIAGKAADSLVPYYGATGQVGWIDEAIFDENLVLLGEDGAPFLDPQKPKAYRIAGKSWVNNHAHVLRAREGVLDWRLLEHQLNTIDYTGFVTGTTRLKLTQGAMNTLPILVPPFQEQTRIASQLDTLLARIQACNDRFDAIPALLKRFRQTVLVTAHAGGLTEDWRVEHGHELVEVTTLGSVLKVSSGNFLPAKDMAPNGEIPVFGGNGVNGYHDHCNVHEKTLVIGRVGFYCGSIHLTPNSAWVTDNALIVRHDPRQTNREYLHYALKAVDLRVNDSSTAQPVISGQKIYPLPLRVPSVAEQLEIVRRVDALFALADRIEARCTAARAQAQRLTPLVLAKAFRGELVPQDPNDEPTSALLARIASSNTTVAGENKWKMPAAWKNRA